MQLAAWRERDDDDEVPEDHSMCEGEPIRERWRDGELEEVGVERKTDCFMALTNSEKIQMVDHR